MFELNFDEDLLEARCVLREDIPDQLILEFFEERCPLYGNRTVLVDVLAGREVGYTELIDMAKAFASKLQAAGFRPNDMIVYRPINSIRSMAGLLALLFMQCSVMCVAPTLKLHDIHQLIHDKRPVGAVAMGPLSHDLVEIAKTHETMKIVIDFMDDNLWNGKPEDFVRPPRRDPRTIKSLLVFTSGSTGPSKMVEFSQRNLIASMWTSGVGAFRLELSGVTTPPLSHLSGACVFFWYLHSCNKYYVVPEQIVFNDLERFVDILHKIRVKNVILFPVVCNAIVNNIDSFAGKLSELRQITTAGSVVPLKVLEKLFDGLPNLEYLLNGFAMSESCIVAGGVTRRGDRLEDVKYLSVGVNCAARIEDPETRKVLPPGESGEFVVKSPTLAMGYFNNESATQSTFVDGWLRTGDIGVMDERGRVKIIDRLKEIMKCCDCSVAPSDIEDLLRRCLQECADPTFREVADLTVVGIPDQRYTEAPTVYVVPPMSLENDKTRLDELARTLMSYMELNHSKSKWLYGGVVFLKSIPKTNTNKFSRSELKKRHLDGTLNPIASFSRE